MSISGQFEPEPARRAPAPAETEPLRPVNILIVDDDPRNLNVLESILACPEYRLVRARGADEALRALVSDSFALLVLDVRMPDMSGLELAQLIKQRKKTQNLPIIFLTAYYQQDEHVLLGYDVGAVDYLNKPCNPAVLRSKVAVFVNLYRANRALEEEVAERRQAEERLAQRTAEVQQFVSQLRALAAELTQTELRERKRLAKILHDHIQQLLVSAKMHLTSLSQEQMDTAAWESVQEIEEILKEAIAASRSVTVELSPPILQEAGLCAALHWLSRRMREKYRFQVEVTTDDDAEPAGEEEKFLLFECTRELLFNAFKHSGQTLARVHLRRSSGDWMQISVDDDGCGADLAELQQRNVDQVSFGLFSIQQRLVHLGGTMKLDSAPGSGMRITLTVPFNKAALPSEPAIVPTAAATAPTPLPSAGGDQISVLVVDDHLILRQGLIGLLKNEPDIQIVGEAEDAEQARVLFEKLAPQVVLMDVNLGESSGVDLTRLFLNLRPRTAVVGLSMHDDQDIAATMKNAGAAAYLTKSVASSELVATIRNVHRIISAAPLDSALQAAG